LANDGEWECLFDDRCAVRSDQLDEKWVEHALLYWTDPDLGFVRCSEKMCDAIRDPNNRKAPKQRLYTLETRIGDMYEAHSRTPTTGKLDSTPMRAAPPPPPRPSGDLLPGAEVVQAEAGK